IGIGVAAAVLATFIIGYGFPFLVIGISRILRPLASFSKRPPGRVVWRSARVRKVRREHFSRGGDHLILTILPWFSISTIPCWIVVGALIGCSQVEGLIADTCQWFQSTPVQFGFPIHPFHFRCREGSIQEVFNFAYQHLNSKGFLNEIDSARHECFKIGKVVFSPSLNRRSRRE